jgi:NAD(P)H-dependent flavin oxidoreductase YrpB (nitropropane dioxygenase family)
MLARDLKNSFTSKYLEMRTAGASFEELNAYHEGHSQYHAQHLGQADEAELCCGQVAGLISEVKTAGEVMYDVVESIEGRFEELKSKLADFF